MLLLHFIHSTYNWTPLLRQHLQRAVPVVTDIHLNALFISLKHCPSEEATTKELCLFLQTVLVTFSLFEQKDYLNGLSLCQERKHYTLFRMWCTSRVRMFSFSFFFFLYLHFSWVLIFLGIYSITVQDKHLLDPSLASSYRLLSHMHFGTIPRHIYAQHTITLQRTISICNQRLCIIVNQHVCSFKSPCS